MFSYVNVKIVFVAFISEKCIGLFKHFHIKKTAESCNFPGFGRQSPCSKIQVENIILNNKLFYPVCLAVKVSLSNITEPGIVYPFP